MKEVFYVYMITDHSKRYLYLGITTQLKKRVDEHRLGCFMNADQKVRFTRLVYFEKYKSLKEALLQEARLSQLKQSEREELITKGNPKWDDLIGQTESPQ